MIQQTNFTENRLALISKINFNHNLPAGLPSVGRQAGIKRRGPQDSFGEFLGAQGKIQENRT
jgi:hypothetical protein